MDADQQLVDVASVSLQTHYPRPLWVEQNPIRQRSDWDDNLLEITGLSRHHMPSLVAGSEISGRVIPEHQKLFGADNIPVAGGGRLRPTYFSDR